MLRTLKRWWSGTDAGVDLAAVQAWAADAGCTARRDRDSGKLVIEGCFDRLRWRFEHGVPQRNYLHGGEARMRMALPLPHDLHLLLMSRDLFDRLESAAYERYTRPVGRSVDSHVPEELRWLATYPRVTLPAHPGFGAACRMVASQPNAGRAWVDGPLADRLVAFGDDAAGGPPLLLMTLGGRLYLRMEVPRLQLALLEEIVALFRLASDRAREVLAGWSEEGEGAWTSTRALGWHTASHIELPL